MRRLHRRESVLTAIIFLSLLGSCQRSEQSDPAALTDRGQERSEVRLITLSPHLAELVYAVGAGDMLVGVSAYTDYPVETLQLPVVGDAFALDQELLAILQPDVLLAWRSGTPAHIVEELGERGYRVEVFETANLADIGLSLRKIGALTGHKTSADSIAKAFESGVLALRKQHHDAAPIKVFYQVAKRPLYTINGTHYISELIDICGGRNIFADLGDLAPLVGVEAVLARNPEVLLASDDAGADAFSDWDRWPDLAANIGANRFLLPAAEIGRATPRLLVAAEALCSALEQSRSKRPVK